MPVTSGLVLGGAGLIGKLLGRHSANQKLKALQGEDPIYSANPLVAQRLGLAQTLLNARMPGAATAEQNIYTTQANEVNNAQKGATDASQFLATGGAIQTNTNKAFNTLGIDEANDYQRRYGNYAGANEASVNEGEKVFNDQVRRFNDKAQIEGAESENTTSGFSDIANFGLGVADIGANGGFSNFLKKQRGATVQNVVTP